MTADQSRRPWADWLPLAMVVLVTLVFAFSYSQSVVLMDTARDLYKATDIARWQAFPSLGPDIGGFFHTGPIWFYFLALPSLTGSLLVVAWWVGLAAGLKYYLAYRLGSELIDRRLGLLWAMLLLLPGWQVINQVFISHFNLLETLTLLWLLLLLRFVQSGRLSHWYCAALVAGLGFHAHPSFLVLMVFGGPVIWYRHAALTWRAYWVAGLLFLLPLLPYLVDQLLHQFPDWQRLSQREATADQLKATGGAIEQPAWWQRLWLTVYSLLVTGPQRIVQFVVVHKPGLGQWMTGLYGLVVLGLLMGLWRLYFKPTHRRWFGGLLVGLLLGVVLVTSLRSFTPFYMLLTLTPLLAGLMALSLHALVAAYRPLLGVFTVALLLLGIGPMVAFHQASTNQQINLGSVMNVIEQPAPDWWQSHNTLDAITLQDSHDLSTLFCGQNSVVNGPYAAVLEMTGGALVHFFCPQQQLQLGGVKKDHDQAVFIMHKSFWDRLSRGPEQWVTPSWGLTTGHQNHAPQTAVTLVPFDDYVHPPRTNMAAGEVTAETQTIATTNAPYLVISHLMPTQMRFAVDAVKANGQVQKPVVQNAVNRVYHCADCGAGPVSWQVDYRANDPTAIDFNTLPQ
ncbi:hypothetical protein [Marinicella meishanensis]|uniref:hypothetical protein n=1 Tax=Marinicella meishanensis TaxID=2873263 RepID=UPI001CC15C55|nr:hypothetical protein [Marinicella sp. NBU2979]